MEKYYVGLDAYDKISIESLCARPEIKGLVLGDLLCTKRMFTGGISEEIRMLMKVAETGKEIIYQTPLYVTSRNWDEIFSIIDMLNITENKIHVIAQDVGVVTKVHENYPQMHVVWGRMGRDRACRFTENLLLELKAAGIDGMETENPSQAKLLSELGITPYLVYGNLQYQTVGRVCYTKYQTGTCDRESCLSGAFSLREKNGTFEMSVDGYLMGEKFHYGNLQEMRSMTKNNEAELTVYARTYEELQNCLNWETK